MVEPSLRDHKCASEVQEIEAITTGKRTTAQITADINFSNAIFVLLNPHVQDAPHTRDWVVSESASGVNRDVWVLEAVEDMPNLSVVIPRVRHYVLFDYTDPWVVYLRQIVPSYDDSHFLQVAALGAGLGGGISAKAKRVRPRSAIFLAAKSRNTKIAEVVAVEKV